VEKLHVEIGDRLIAIGNVKRAALGEFSEHRGLDIAPVFDVDWALVKRPSFTETDAAPVNLHVEAAKDSVTTIRLGFDLGTSWLKKGYWTDFLESTDGVWQPSLSVKWRQVVGGGESRGITSNIVGAPPVTGMTTVLSDDAKQGIEIGAGVWFTPKMANRVSIGARYDAFVWTDVVSHDLLGTVMYSFF